MRVVFLGNARWSVPSLEAVAASAHRPVLVLTRTPRPAGRGNRLTPTAVAGAARDLGLDLREVDTVKAGPGLDELAGVAPEALVVVAYGEILPQRVLDVPTVAPVNVHFSLLPELRGAAPVQRALLDGLAATGVTTIRMDAGMDTGPILLQAEEGIDPDDDAGRLGARLAAIGGRLLVDTLDRLAAGTLEERPQDDLRATFAPKLSADERRIDWSEPADRVVRRVRALAPEPGATTTFRGAGLKILSAVETERGATRGDEAPGTVLAATRDAVLVAAGAGSVVALGAVAPEGRRRMSGGEFARGRRIDPGERLA